MTTPTPNTAVTPDENPVGDEEAEEEESGGIEEGAEEEQVAEPEKTGSQLLSVEGIMMLLVAIMFDMAGIFCAFLVWVLGIGAVLGRIVSAAGLVVFTIWAAFRGGESRGKEGRGEAQQLAKKVLQRFLKKHWKKLTVEAIPFLGDIAPTFIMMWYSELK